MDADDGSFMMLRATADDLGRADWVRRASAVDMLDALSHHFLREAGHAEDAARRLRRSWWSVFSPVRLVSANAWDWEARQLRGLVKRLHELAREQEAARGDG
jgi:hypothetical protein